MDVVSTGPLRVASVLWQARPATWVLTVVCKVTFTLAPEELVLAPAQDPIRDRDTHFDDDRARSLREAADLAPVKQGACVVLTGHAYAPVASPVRSLRARMIVGEIDKVIEVFCDRFFTPRGEVQEGPRFVRMPLAYERAAGGPETSNPVGVRRDVVDAYGRIAIPNLVPVDHVISAPADAVPTMGFGPIAPTWPLRRQKVGRHAAAFASGALPPGPLPEDLDRSFFSIAPLDQQLPDLRNDERIVLENLHPEHPVLVTRLPGIRPRAIVTSDARGTRDIPIRCDTLAIDTERMICKATWRAQLPLASPDEAGQVRVELSASVRPAAASSSIFPRPVAPPSSIFPRPVAPAVQAPVSGNETMLIVTSEPLHDVRLAPPPSPPPPTRARPVTMVSQAAPNAASPAVRARIAPQVDQTLELTEAVAAMNLPFVGAPSPSAAPSSSNPPPAKSKSVLLQRPVDTTADLSDDSVEAQSALPFPPSSGEHAHAPSPAIPGAPWSVQRASAPPPLQDGQTTLVVSEGVPEPAPYAPPPPATRARSAPTMQSPVFPAMERSTLMPTAFAMRPPPDLSAPAPVAPAIPPQPPAPLEAPTSMPAAREEIRLEKHAAISAELAERGAPRGEILGAHGLTDTRWMEAEKHWTEALAEEAKHGGHTLLDAHDDAFVRAWEAIRGPFDISDYVRLTLANERGELAAMLDRLAIRRTIWMRLKRIYARRSVTDRGFRARIKQALADQRRTRH